MNKLRYIALAAFFLFFNETSFSQWQRLFYQPGKPVYSVYFLPDSSGIPQIGFAGLGNEIWRTGDAGKTWTRVSTSIVLGCQFAFKDTLTGWCASRGGGVYKTTDGGWNWTLLNFGQDLVGFSHSCEGIFYNPSLKRLFCASWNDYVIYSNDEGATWIVITKNDGAAHSGIDFITPIDGIITSYVRTIPKNWLITHDGGISWTKLTFAQECWQLLAIPTTQTYFAACEGDGNGLNRTDDGGSTWKQLKNGFPTIRGKITGDIHGDLCRLYIQTYWDEAPTYPSGILRSLTEGESWDFLGGPGSFYDRRFYTIGRYIYAGDTLGGVWMLLDTLPIPLQNNIELASNSVNFDTIINCKEPILTINMKNHLSCFPAMVKKIQWSQVIGSNPFSLLSQPGVVLAKSEDSLLIKFNSTGAGKFLSILHLTFTIDGHDFDTTISVSGVRKMLSNASLSTAELQFDTVATCTQKILTVTITNTGCDSEIIHIGNLPSGYILLQPLSDTSIQPGDSMIVQVGLSSKTTGTYSGFFNVYATPRNSPQSTYGLNLDGYIAVLPNSLLIYPSVISFDSVSFCDTAIKQLSIIIKNPSDCDSLHLDSLWIEDATNLFFTLSKSPFDVAASDSQKLSLTFKAGNKGIHRALLHFRFKDGISTRDTAISVQAFVYAGKGILSVTDSIINFGATTMCEDRDTIIHIVNTGCDTLQVCSFGFQGSGFGTDSKLPITILPGHDTIFDVFTVLDTSGGKTSNNASLLFTSNSGAAISPIFLSRSYTASQKINLGLFIDPTPKKGTDQNAVTFDIKETPGKSFTGAGIKQINFDLNYNTNLLTFDQPSSKNITSSNGINFILNGSKEITADANGVLASVGFTVFLTNDSMTNIDMTYRSDTTYMPCTVLTTTIGGMAVFDYQFLCGERSIAGFMNGVMPLKIISTRPNPAQDEIELNIQSFSTEDAFIEIYDALGTRLFSDIKNLTQGTNSIRLNTKSFSGGVYLVRLHSTNSETSQSFVKVR